MRKVFNLNSIQLSCFVIVFLLGLAIRTIVYFQNVSFFSDECALLSNFEEQSYFGLFFPIHHFQQGPPLFLIAGKFLYYNFGQNELVLRFLPYLSGCLSLFVFFFLVMKVLKSFWSRIFAFTLMAFSSQVIYFSQIYKQYTTEMLFSALACLVIFSIDTETFSRKMAVRLGILSALAFWVSYDMTFVVFGIAGVFCIKSLAEKKYDNFKNWLVFTSIAFVSFVIYFCINLSGPFHSKVLEDYWAMAHGFFPFTKFQFMEMITFLFTGHIPSFKPLMINLGLVAAFSSLIFLIGLLRLFVADRPKAFILFVPILFTAIAGLLHLYPFAHRLLLFLFPQVFLIFAFSIEKTKFSNKLVGRIVAVLVVLHLFLSGSIKTGFYLLSGKYNFEVTGVRQYMAILKNEKLKKEDLVYFYAPVGNVHKYYNKKFKLLNDYQMVIEPWRAERESLNHLPSKRVIYFYLIDSLLVSEEENSWRMTWIKQNCDIQKIIQTRDGVCIKCLKLRK